MNLFTILNGNNYLTVNREIARLIGLEAAILLSEILDKMCYFEKNGLEEEGWFYLTFSTVEERTTLSRRQQETAIDHLKAWEFIETKQMGLPAKRHFRVFKKKITDWLMCTNKKDKNPGRSQTPTNKDSERQSVPSATPIVEEPYIKEPYSLVPPVGETTQVDPPKEKKKREIPQEAKDIASLLWQQIQKIHPNHKPPKLQEWAETFEKCHRIDRRSWDELRSVINFSFEKDPFWAQNLQSAEGLRKHFDKIFIKMKPVDNEGTRHQRNLEIAQKIKASLAESNEAHLLMIHKNSVSRQSGDSIPMSLPPETFENVLVNWFKLGKNDE